jgi:hypothetical protein
MARAWYAVLLGGLIHRYAEVILSLCPHPPSGNRGPFSTERMLGLRQCLTMLQCVPPAEQLVDAPSPAHYQRVYETMKALPSPAMALTDVPDARRLQAAAIQYSFFRWLGLSFDEFDDDQAAAFALAHRGSVSATIVEFLRFSGCPEIPVDVTLLRQRLSPFVAQASAVEGRVASRSQLLRALRQQARALKRLWPRVRAELLQAYWRWNDAVEQRCLTGRRRRAMEAFQEARLRMDGQQQRSLLCILVCQVHGQAIMALAAVAEHHHLSDAALERAIACLQDILQQFLDRHIVQGGRRVKRGGKHVRTRPQLTPAPSVLGGR